VSYTFRNQTVVAEIAEVEVNRKTGRVWVKRLVAAHDCGLVINPEALRRTIEGGMLHSISRALYEEVAFDSEKVLSADWITHPTLTHLDAPAQIDVVIVNGDPNPNRPDLPHYGRRRDVVQADARRRGERHLRCHRRAAPARAVQKGAGARGAERGERVIYGFLATPVGRLLVARDPAGIRLIYFDGPAEAGPYVRRAKAEGGPHARAGMGAARCRVRRSRDTVEGVLSKGVAVCSSCRLRPRARHFRCASGTRFSKFRTVKPISYGELAARIGDRSASRAVGLANGSNPLPIVIPCHRVIGSNGKLTGYGGGLPIKERLLTLEGALPGRTLFHRF
jgi:methylated-DNA-[protein]-cysteine S-methyltransferase